MTSFRTRLALSCLIAVISVTAQAASVGFVTTPAGASYDYLYQGSLPAGFGTGDFTVSVWVKPDHTLPVGSTADGSAGQRTNWSSSDEAPYSSSSWWYKGNFLLDGHNNSNFANGTFSLQFYGGGRVRWLFGDGTTGIVGGQWSIGAYPATNTPSLLDGRWHLLAMTRRCASSSSATLELWVDGALVASQKSGRCADMRSYWASWAGYPSSQRGWWWGAEKQAALNMFDYEDYKGLLDDLRLWTRALSASELAVAYTGRYASESGLAAAFEFTGSSGSTSCSRVASTDCASLVNAGAGSWVAVDAPTTHDSSSSDETDDDDDASTDAEPPTTPTGLAAVAISSTRVDLSWSPSLDNVGVAQYQLLRNGETISEGSTATAFRDTTVLAATHYEYSVRALDAAGNASTASAVSSVLTPAVTDTTAPSTPATISVSTLSSTSLRVTWSASSDENGVASYLLVRDGSAVTSGLTSTSFTDTGLSAGRRYTYTVYAVDVAGNHSAASVAASGTTAAATTSCTTVRRRRGAYTYCIG